MRVLAVIVLTLGTLVSADRMSIRLYNGTVAKLWDHNQDIGWRFGCDHTSYSVVKCIKDYVDLNHDDGITESEIDAAKSLYMHWYEKFVDSIVNAGSSKDIRVRCDLNENGKIDIDDLIEWNHECRKYHNEDEANADKGHTCMCNCESIDSISKYVCDRARE